MTFLLRKRERDARDMPRNRVFYQIRRVSPKIKHQTTDEMKRRNFLKTTGYAGVALNLISVTGHATGTSSTVCCVVNGYAKEEEEAAAIGHSVGQIAEAFAQQAYAALATAVQSINPEIAGFSVGQALVGLDLFKSKFKQAVANQVTQTLNEFEIPFAIDLHYSHGEECGKYINPGVATELPTCGFELTISFEFTFEVEGGISLGVELTAGTEFSVGGSMTGSVSVGVGIMKRLTPTGDEYFIGFGSSGWPAGNQARTATAPCLDSITKGSMGSEVVAKLCWNLAASLRGSVILGPLTVEVAANIAVQQIPGHAVGGIPLAVETVTCDPFQPGSNCVE